MQVTKGDFEWNAAVVVLSFALLAALVDRTTLTTIALCGIAWGFIKICDMQNSTG